MPITKNTLDFLVENRLHDSKEWFHEHKAQYEELVLTPLRELIVHLQPTLLELDPALIVDAKGSRCISRIYRDTRFAKDKSVYRENVWLIFIRDKKLYEGPPGIFFEFCPDWIRYGCGYYQAGRDSMEILREMMLENDPAFASAYEAYQTQDVYTLEGDSYRKNHFPEAPEPLWGWLNRKSICFTHNTTDFEWLFSDRLAGQLEQDFKLLAPFYHFLIRAEEERVRRSGPAR